MLAKNHVKITAEEQEELDSMRFNWKKMNDAAADSSSKLVSVQPEFKDKLFAAMEQVRRAVVPLTQYASCSTRIDLI